MPRRSTAVQDPGTSLQPPRRGWRVSLNRLVWRAHIVVVSSLVIWVEKRQHVYLGANHVVAVNSRA